VSGFSSNVDCIPLRISVIILVYQGKRRGLILGKKKCFS
jgi:hypothetical protein